MLWFVVGPIERFRFESLNRRIRDDPPYRACSVQSAPTPAPTLIEADRGRVAKDASPASFSLGRFAELCRVPDAGGRVYLNLSYCALIT